MDAAPPLTDADARSSLVRAARRLRARFLATRGRVVAVLALQVVRTAAELTVPILLARTIGSLEGAKGSGALPTSFTALLVATGAAVVLRSALQWLCASETMRLALDAESDLRGDLFDKLMRLPFLWHDENRAGKTLTRALRDMERTRHYFREVWFGYVEVGLVLVGVLGLSFWLHWSYGVGIGGIFLVSTTLTLLAGRRIARLDRRIGDLYDRVTAVLQENVAGARVVRAFGLEAEESARFRARLEEYTGAWQALVRFWTTAMPTIHHLSQAVVPVALLTGGLRAASGEGGLGELAAVLFYARTARDRLRPTTRLVLLGQESVASAARVLEILDAPEPAHARTTPAPLPEGPGELRIEGVRFSRPGGRAALRGVSLVVPGGTSLGILGPTGSGKTSLVHLLPRFYDPDEGRILLDGADLRDLDPRALARAVALVFQEPFLFSARVSENVGYGKPDLDGGALEACTRLAAAHEFVERLPRGYDTVIGERGITLSGGQRQRLAIARALAMDPRVLVFDDATASVDAVTERGLFEGIRAAARGRTTIVISQRVTAVRWCDRVAVLDAGAVLAEGTHAELVRSCLLYRELLEHQRLAGVVS